MIIWIAFYIFMSLLHKWIISWGGAKTIQGWKSFFILDWFAWDWNVEQIRFYAVLSWIIFTLIFVLGCFNPQFRQEYLS